MPWKGQFENYYYSNGKIAQEYVEYHENGQKKIVGIFINNKKSGAWSEWFEDGTQKYSGNYLNGKKHGRWVEWEDEGNEIINGEYKNGQKWEGRFGDNNYISGLQREEYSEQYPSGSMKATGILVNKV